MSDLMSEATDEPRFNTIDEAVDALRRGLMVIVVDAAERENEGDFVCAAESITAEQVDFMLRHGSGVLCVPMSEDCAEQLQLAPLSDNHGPGPQTHTNFLTPVDHANAGTGVSAANPAMTHPAHKHTTGQGRRCAQTGRTHRGDSRPGSNGWRASGRMPDRNPLSTWRRHG